MEAENIKEYRKRHNLTQEGLAEIVGTSVRAVQSWEQGQRNITQGAIKLMELYEVQDRSISIGGDNNGVANTGIIIEDNTTQNTLIQMLKQQLQQSYHTINLLEKMINDK